MGTRDRPIERANRAAADMLGSLGRELRLARTSAGLSQREVAAASATSHSAVSRVENGQSPEASLLVLARISAVVGLDLSLRAFPDGDPARDVAHSALLGRLHARIDPDLTWRTEVPLPLPGDRRAWDALIRGENFTIGVEAETRLRDGQAVTRRIRLKLRDGGLDHVILLVSDTRTNRYALRTLIDDLAPLFPISQRDALAALRDGRDPGGSAIIVL